MKYIRILIIFSSLFLFLQYFGFLIHNNKLDISLTNKLKLSDILIYIGFIPFLLSTIGAYFISIHRFLITSQANITLKNIPKNRICYHIKYHLFFTCLTIYALLMLSLLTILLINIISSETFYFHLLFLTFDIQILCCSVPIFQTLKKVIAISRSSARSVRWSVSSITPQKLLYKMANKAVRMGVENILLDILLIIDLLVNILQIVFNSNSLTVWNMAEQNYDFFDNHSTHERIPNISVAHLLLIYSIQFFLMIFCIDYSWISKKYITIHKNNKRKVRKRSKKSKSFENNSRQASNYYPSQLGNDSRNISSVHHFYNNSMVGSRSPPSMTTMKKTDSITVMSTTEDTVMICDRSSFYNLKVSSETLNECMVNDTSRHTLSNVENTIIEEEVGKDEEIGTFSNFRQISIEVDLYEDGQNGTKYENVFNQNCCFLYRFYGNWIIDDKQYNFWSYTYC